jgi:hypothetical protein
MVGVECAEVGTKLVVEMGDQRAEPVVSAIPFIDNKEKVGRGITDDQ